jgi:hypothetical protein
VLDLDQGRCDQQVGEYQDAGHDQQHQPEGGADREYQVDGDQAAVGHLAHDLAQLRALAASPPVDHEGGDDPRKQRFTPEVDHHGNRDGRQLQQVLGPRHPFDLDLADQRVAERLRGEDHHRHRHEDLPVVPVHGEGVAQHRAKAQAGALVGRQHAADAMPRLRGAGPSAADLGRGAGAALRDRDDLAAGLGDLGDARENEAVSALAGEPVELDQPVHGDLVLLVAVGVRADDLGQEHDGEMVARAPDGSQTPAGYPARPWRAASFRRAGRTPAHSNPT